jgi:poly(beta-D-mannuronate) lyase
MKRLLLLNCFLLAVLTSIAETPVRNITELNNANKNAKPGDVIVLEDGDWNDVTIALDCKGTKDQPIRFKARTQGKVYISGHSQLKLGGEYIIVEGLSFERGYAGKDDVISFRINKDKLANNCRVTNCAVDDFNNPRRMDENNWVAFYGKNNRLDHCSFVNKKNMGVLLAVHLDDDRSRENFHSIDHNYFGVRTPLASNGGEIIRVGVSQHCQFNSNTIIADNHFRQCDGETEIISIKSGSNVVRGNIFDECQGSVVLRHGDNNTVTDNVFFGNGKEGTGGVRVINRGQWVVNNLFSGCTGTGFRSPLAIMNGVPNSPAHRYVQVTDAVIANNTFVSCAPASLCEGSDKERSVPPANVLLLNNEFDNTANNTIYNAYDDISGFSFSGNKIRRRPAQSMPAGFERAAALPDSLQRAAQARLGYKLGKKAGVITRADAPRLLAQKIQSGAAWFRAKGSQPPQLMPTINCATSADVYKALIIKAPIVIKLTGNVYELDKPFIIAKQVVFTSDNASTPRTINTGKMLSVFLIRGNGHLKLQNLSIQGGGVNATHFISSDTAGSSAHYNLVITKCAFRGIGAGNTCADFFYAYKSMVADSIVIRNSAFHNNQVNFLSMNQEKDDKGYYNAEKIVLNNNNFTDHGGSLLDIYRGGNDESTMGPYLMVNENYFAGCAAADGKPLIQLTGVQKTRFLRNTFTDCSIGKTLFAYKDIVRADHLLKANVIKNSGEIQANNFVKQFPKAE